MLPFGYTNPLLTDHCVSDIAFQRQIRRVGISSYYDTTYESTVDICLILLTIIALFKVFVLPFLEVQKLAVSLLVKLSFREMADHEPWKRLEDLVEKLTDANSILHVDCLLVVFIFSEFHSRLH